MSSRLLIILWLECILSTDPDPHCIGGVLHQSYGICGICPNSCDLYCDTNASANTHCCCDEIIKAGHSCNLYGPPCLIELTNQIDSDYNYRILFGIETSTYSSDSIPILLTLFWDNYQYECAVYTSNTTSFLFCDTSDTDTKSCPVLLSPSTVSYGLQIDYSGDTPLFIDKIIIREIHDNILSNLYIVDNFFSNHSDIDEHHDISIQNDHNLVIFNHMNTTQIFSNAIEGYTQPQTTYSVCSKANFVKTVPETINNSFLAQEICIFGSHHSFLDGTYTLIAWDLDENGPIYYDENEHKYLYPINTEYYFQWQIHEDYTPGSMYSICNMEKNDEYRYYVQNCKGWKTDINLLNDVIDDDELEYDEFVLIDSCNDNTVNDDSITVEIEALPWNLMNVPDVLSLTLYWNDTKYKCSIYTTRYDYDYSCNTKLSAIQCQHKHLNPVNYGLQIDVFGDDKDHKMAQDIAIQSITIKYMKGNMVRDTHKMEHFCTNEECLDILNVANHTLVTFTYNDVDVDALHAHIEHTQSLSQCIPTIFDIAGYPIKLNKYILVQTNISWEDASRYCKQTFNTSLATITDYEDLLNAIALRELNNSNADVWIGLNDIGETGRWTWQDGTSCDYSDKGLCGLDSNWAHGKPDDHAFESCAEMSGANAMGKFNNDYCSKGNIFLCHNIVSDTIPDAFISNIPQEICVFGSRHSFLDGSYQFVAWNTLVQAPIYYDENEHKYLYPVQTKNNEYQWQIHENYLSDEYYSHCEVESINLADIQNVSYCKHWKADISGSGITKDDPFVTVRACDNIYNESDWLSSITFEIETDWDITGGAITLTFYWEGMTYKCTVYSDDDDQDYSCNTYITARKCDERWTVNPVQYGLQMDVFGDDSDIFYVQSITIKYMIGNVVRDSHKIEHFYDIIDAYVYDKLQVYDHTLINFTYQHSDDIYFDVDALPSHIEHAKSLSPCVPDGYNDTDNNRYILVEDEKSWMEAKEICKREYGSSLATIIDGNDLLDAVALRELNRPNEDIWIGLNAMDHYLDWKWDDDTSCHRCEHHEYWIDNYPVKDASGDEVCVEMSGEHATGYFKNADCDDEHIFLCNVPTPDPTPAPTQNPTPNPTHFIDLHDIAILMHSNVSEDNGKWIAFSLHNIDLSCGGDVYGVHISDTYPYQWVNYTLNVSGYYIFKLNKSFDPPVAVQIARRYNGGMEILNQSNVIEDLISDERYDYRTNFCTKPLPIEETGVFFSLYGWIIGVIFVFFIVGLTGWLDAKYFRKNDHFVLTAIISSLFQLLDILSDIFFCIEVEGKHRESALVGDHNSTIFLIITMLSLTFIISPVFISMYQLHDAAHKDWIKDNRIRHWLTTYSALLYTASIVIGSAFNAIQIFNSNLYSLDMFYMSLHRRHILKFHTKKLHSIILFENMPQLILSVWYMWTLQALSYVSLTQIFFSLLSIFVTIITIILQTSIDKSQDEVQISMDISGEGVMANRKRIKNHTRWLKKYLARNILGVNAKWVEIQKPYAGGIVMGLRLKIYVSFINDEVESVYEPPLERKFKDSLKDAIRDGSLKCVMKEEWRFTDDQPFEVRLHECVFNESIRKQMEKTNTGEVAMTAGASQWVRVKTADDDEKKTEDYEGESSSWDSWDS